MNYLQFKRKVFMTNPYSILFCIVDTALEMELSITTINANGVPFLCAFGNEATIEAAITVLSGVPLAVGVTGALTAEMTFDILSKVSIAVVINPALSISVDMDTLISKIVTTDITCTTLFTTIINVAQTDNFASVVEIPITVGVNTTIASEDHFASTLELELVIAAAMICITENVFDVDMSFTATLTLATTIGDALSFVLSHYAEFDSSLDTTILDSKHLHTDLEVLFNTVTELDIVAIATLGDHDAKTLGIMDSSTLNELNYTL